MKKYDMSGLNKTIILRNAYAHNCVEISSYARNCLEKVNTEQELYFAYDDINRFIKDRKKNLNLKVKFNNLRRELLNKAYQTNNPDISKDVRKLVSEVSDIDELLAIKVDILNVIQGKAYLNELTILKKQFSESREVSAYLSEMEKKGVSNDNITEISQNIKSLQEVLNIDLPAVDYTLKKALLGLTEAELNVIFSCLMHKNSYSSYMKKIPVGKVSLKFFAAHLSSEICLYGNSTLDNTLGNFASYQSIRFQSAIQLGWKNKEPISEFLNDLNKHSQIKKREQILKGIKTLGTSTFDSADILLSHVVPIIERSYQYSNIDIYGVDAILEQALKVEETDLLIERILPYFNHITYEWDSTFVRRNKLQEACKKNLFTTEQMHQVESTWQDCSKNPNKRYVDVAAAIIGVDSGEKIADKAVEEIKFYQESVETLRKQIAGELCGNRAKGGVDAERYKGDIFERLNVIFFNKNASSMGSDVRAYTTDDLGLKNHQVIDIVVLSEKDKAYFDSLNNFEDKNAFISLQDDHWQAKCNNNAAENINSLSKYQGTGFLGSHSEKDILAALGNKSSWSERQVEAFRENYTDTLNAYGISGETFTVEETIEIAKCSPSGLSDEAQSIILKRIDDELKDVGKNVVNAAINAALIGGVVSAFIEAISCYQEKVPLKVAAKRVATQAALGATKSAVRAALVTLVTAYAKKYAAQKVMGAVGAKALGKSAGMAAVFVIETGWDLFQYQRGKIDATQLQANVGNNALGLGAGIGIVVMIGTGGLGAVLGVVAGGTISMLNPVGRFVVTDYESILKYDPYRGDKLSNSVARFSQQPEQVMT